VGKLQGRTAIVTGGSRGIGRAVCLRFASEGANVAINYAGNVDAANEVADAARKLGVKAEIYKANVADQHEVQAMCDKAIGDFGQIDILINNAGLGSSHVNRPTIVDATIEQYEMLMGVNLWGPIHMCRALVPHMRQAKRSDVIMTSSVAAQSMGPKMGLYSITKAGVEALAHTLAKEERANGMRVNIIAPGLVDTDMGRKLLATMGVNADMSQRASQSPFGMVCTPDDIASAMMFLVSEDGRYITNERVTVSGGGF
jgi:NAD(P)-dependent dehydrogenase (short-subunit alcohol dehydrogenase family)